MAKTILHLSDTTGPCLEGLDDPEVEFPQRLERLQQFIRKYQPLATRLKLDRPLAQLFEVFVEGQTIEMQYPTSEVHYPEDSGTFWAAFFSDDPGGSSEYSRGGLPREFYRELHEILADSKGEGEGSPTYVTITHISPGYSTGYLELKADGLHWDMTFYEEEEEEDEDDEDDEA
jgi:hypothetical protein